MSGIGRTLADLELRNAATMRSAQAAYDNMLPPEPTAEDDLAAAAKVTLPVAPPAPASTPELSPP